MEQAEHQRAGHDGEIPAERLQAAHQHATEHQLLGDRRGKADIQPHPNVGRGLADVVGCGRLQRGAEHREAELDQDDRRLDRHDQDDERQQPRWFHTRMAGLAEPEVATEYHPAAHRQYEAHAAEHREQHDHAGQLHEGGAERLGRQRSSPRGSAQAQYDADDERGQYVHAHEHALVGEYQARVAGDGASQPAAAGLDRVDRDGLGDRDGRRDGSLRRGIWRIRRVWRVQL